MSEGANLASVEDHGQWKAAELSSRQHRVPMWEFPRIRGTVFWVLTTRILLFRVLYQGPLFNILFRNKVSGCSIFKNDVRWSYSTDIGNAS